MFARVRRSSRQNDRAKSRPSREPARSVFQQHLCGFWHLGRNRAFPRAAEEVKRSRRGRESSKTRQLRGSPCSWVPDTHLPFTKRLTWLNTPERARQCPVCGRVYPGPPCGQKGV